MSHGSQARAPLRALVRARVLLALGAALAILLGPAPARAGDPDLVWRTITTEHFRVHHHVEVERLARRLAVVAEHAHARLTRALDHTPAHPLDVVLIDSTDDVNGYAYAYPYPRVVLFATAPDDRSDLNDYDDYLLYVFTHEYTHVLHADAIHGLWRWINWVLGFGGRGRVFSPNSAEPTFLVEGLAVFEEGERTSGGRLRSSLFDMYLRMAALEGRLYRLDELSNASHRFPRGNAPYLYGAYFMRFVARRYGEQAVRRFVHDYGGTWIPGGVNRVMRRVTGRTITELWAELLDDLGARYRRRRDAIRAAGETPVEILTGPRDNAARPTFTPDGRAVIWSDADNVSRPRLRRLELDSEVRPGSRARAARAPGTMAVVDGAGGSVFAPDGRTLYYAAIDVWRTNYFFSDLWSLDVASGRRRRLTDGLRAAEPDLSPDGRTLVFTVNEGGSRALVTMPVEGGPVRRLVGNRDDLGQVFTPCFSPDGRRVAFSWWRAGGMRDLYVYDLATGTLDRLTADRALDLDPRFSPDGRWLYFSSDRTGVYNLYAFELATRRLRQVTNLVSGAFDVTVSPDGRRAVYVGFEAAGWRLEQIALDPAAWRDPLPAALPADGRPDPDIPAGRSDAPSRPYSPWRSAWPHVWSATSYPSTFGQVFALQLQGNDAVGNHAWSLTLGADLGRADAVTAQAAYVYRRLFPTLSVTAARGLALRGRYRDPLGLELPYAEETWSGSASLTLPLLRSIAASSDLGFGYNIAYLRAADGRPGPPDPNEPLPVVPETGLISSVGMSWYHSTVRRWQFSVSAEEGRSIALNLSASLRALGSRYDVYTASWRVQQYIPLRWSFLPWDNRNHVLALSYAGGVSGGDLRRRRVFYLGGYAPQPDLVRAVVDFARPGSASLRGYPYAGISGEQYHVANVEYRFPIAWIERGDSTTPLFFRRLHGAVFADFGNAFDGTPDLSAFKLGLGAELRLELLLGYQLAASLQFGYARGLMQGGENQWYFLLNNPF